jgi:hypothetical protein
LQRVVELDDIVNSFMSLIQASRDTFEQNFLPVMLFRCRITFSGENLDGDVAVKVM